VNTIDREHTNQSPLQSDLGTTIIQDAVVTAIVGMAAEEVEGIDMSHGAPGCRGIHRPPSGSS
jgi:uncharacterized alkaline shock family protein YloU